MMNINRDSPIPAYYQIALDIRARIVRKEWGGGQRIPSEMDLAKEYEVSRVTMRQALSELVNEGVLDRKQGSGTFVSLEPVPLIHDLSLPHIFGERLHKMGFETSSRMIEARTVTDPASEVLEELQLPENAPVSYLKRVLLIAAEPAALNHSWFDLERCPDITQHPLIDGSLSKTLQERYGLVPAYANNWLETFRCSRETAALLNCPLDIPMIRLRTISYLADDTPLEYSNTEWLGDRIRFNFQSRRGGSYNVGPLE